MLALDVQKQSVGLIREELVRQADFLDLAGVRLAFNTVLRPAERRLRSTLGPDTDLVQGYNDALVRHNPGLGADVERLTTEIRRYHGLRPGGPLTRLTPRSTAKRALDIEDGPGQDVAYAAEQRQSLSEPVAYAERRFGSTGPFLRRRKWNIDFYAGPFEDLVMRYRRLGYRDFYRLRAPYISYGREAYVLGPEPDRKLRPRLVYCDFYSRDLFTHTRAQYAVLRRATGGSDPIVQTLTCSDCPERPTRALASLREVLDSAPFQAQAALMGYGHLFEPVLKPMLIGQYDNAHWRVSYYDLPSGALAVVEARQAAFGEAAGEAMAELAARGATQLFYGGPAAVVVAEGVRTGRLYLPESVVGSSGAVLPWTNSLLPSGRQGVTHRSVASPLLATFEWTSRAVRGGVQTIDTELASVVERVLAAAPSAELGVGVVTTSLSYLHPEEDRAVYTVQLEREEVKEAAKRSFRDQVLRKLGFDPATGSARDRGR